MQKNKVRSMRFNLIIILISICICSWIACTEQGAEQGTSSDQSPTTTVDTREETVPDNYISEDGLLIEYFDSTRKEDFNKYNEDNKIYKPGRIFVYDYSYTNQQGEDRTCTLVNNTKVPGNKAWYFSQAKDVSPTTITEIHITILQGIGILQKLRPDYNKTVGKFNYSYPAEMSDFKEQTGIVENEQNVWMTPPRFRMFRMLELNPYPFIKAPFEVGNKWTWKKMIQPRWADVQWVTWDGVLENNYAYEIVAEKRLDTAFGELTCYEVNAIATNALGKSYLRSYFNPEYGFLMLDYINIQGSRMTLSLKSIN